MPEAQAGRLVFTYILRNQDDLDAIQEQQNVVKSTIKVHGGIGSDKLTVAQIVEDQSLWIALGKIISRTERLEQDIGKPPSRRFFACPVSRADPHQAIGV